MTGARRVFGPLNRWATQLVLIAAACLCVALAFWATAKPSAKIEQPTFSPTPSQQPSPTATTTATTPPPPPTSSATFVTRNKGIISSMHETLNDMIERALNEQFDIVESENLDLQQKFSALQALKPPTSIAADWALGIEGASEKLGALRQAAYDHRSSKIAVDEFLNHFAPLRIELVALDDLIGAL